MEVTTTQQQCAALDAIEAWWSAPPGRESQVFRLFGYAGTGKTTIAKMVPALLGIDGRVRFAAYTGKAAHVLQRKGCAPVSTIHSMIYRPIEVVDACPYGKACEARDEDRGTCAHEVKHLEFMLREAIDGDFDEDAPEDGEDPRTASTCTRLIILDEVSMVGEELARDLLSFGVRVLVLGDPAQLPPVSGTGFFTQAEPDFMLTEVHRQAAESPVLRLATSVREGQRWLWPYAQPTMADLHAAGQILVWKNATRWSVVRTLRGALGRTAGVPMVGDRVMCIANNRGLGVFNGQQFWVTSVADGRFGAYELGLIDDEPRAYTLRVMADGFVDQKGEEEARRAGSRGTLAAMTFANAITVHKAQGSEWDSVIVIDESAGLEWVTNKHGEDGALARRTWLYTAITRASRDVVLADARGW